MKGCFWPISKVGSDGINATGIFSTIPGHALVNVAEEGQSVRQAKGKVGYQVSTSLFVQNTQRSCPQEKKQGSSCIFES